MTADDAALTAVAVLAGAFLGTLMVITSQARRLAQYTRRHRRDMREVQAWRDYAKDISKECVGLAVQVVHAKTIAANALTREAEAWRVADGLAGFTTKEGQ